LPIDQIISHIANTTSEKQQIAQTPDSQTGAESTSAEASRRSSTSTQNTDTLTPTNIPSDPTDNQETAVSATSAETVVEAHHNIQNDANNSAFKSYQSPTIHAQMQIQQDTIMSTGQVMSEVSKESQEQQDIIDIKESGMTKETNASNAVAEISTLTVPTASARKVSRFLVSPVVEQKNIAAEEESSVNEGANHTSQSNQSIASAAEPVLKNEEHVVEANVLEIQSMNLHEQASSNENTIVQGVPYTNVEQTDSVQQILQPGQQPLGLQQSIIQVQTMQQVTGHMQQTTTNRSKQHTIIVQGATTTSQQTSQQMPQTSSMQHFVPVNSQKELQPLQPLHTNAIAQTQTQYPNQTIMQQSPAVVMQQQPQQQIPIQQNVIQPHMQVEHQGQMQQAQRASTVQQFVPQQQPSTQQYVILSGHMQSIQPNIDDRNHRVSNISTASNVSMDSQISESSSIPEEKRQTVVTATNMPTAAHMQHVQVVSQDMSNTMPMQQQSASVETAQQTLQTTHQNVQHNVLGTAVPQSMPVSLPVHPDVSTSKIAIKTKEVSSTLPDLAQNLANILSNPKSKSATPHPLTNSHEPTAMPNPTNVAAPTLVDYKPMQSEQYFQPIQPEVSQLPIQPSIQHNYQGQIVHQGYQGQQNFQQTFLNQQLLHQNQTQPILQSIPLTIPQQIDLQSQMMQSNLVTGQATAQGKWFISTNQSNSLQQQQPMLRHMQSNQPFQNQLQQIPMQPQMQQQTMQDQHSESSIVLDQSHLHLKLPDQQPAKLLEVENLESSNLNWCVIYFYSYFLIDKIGKHNKYISLLNFNLSF